MVSSASITRLMHDVEIVQGKHPLTEKESAVLAEVRSQFFDTPAARSVSSWEGEEVKAYWAKLGRTLRTKWYKEHAARFPEKIQEASGMHSHKA